MIVLFTDFDLRDPYVGQLHAVLAEHAPRVPVVDLFHSVPRFDIRAGAYLLPAYVAGVPRDAVCMCVVDPGVGWLRRPVILQADGRWYVGPDNGLFEIVARRAQVHEAHVIRWRPAVLSDSFHGRDLFAPVAARLALGASIESEPTRLAPLDARGWPDDLPQVLYIDHYGNGITGLRASNLSQTATLRINGFSLSYARVFAEASPNAGFWYANANGLVEIAMNQASAAERLGLFLGQSITIVD